MSTAPATPANRPGIDMSLPPEAAHELLIHMEDDDERAWVPRGKNVWFRPLMFNVTQGSWVNITWAEGGEEAISRHRHPAPVTAYTLEGTWGYVEHDWTAKPGTFLFEPAGETHTLIVKPPENRFKVLFHNYGPILKVDEYGNQTGYEDVFTRLEWCKEHYRKVGLGEEFATRLCR